jgi:hypothetical protein
MATIAECIAAVEQVRIRGGRQATRMVLTDADWQVVRADLVTKGTPLPPAGPSQANWYEERYGAGCVGMIMGCPVFVGERSVVESDVGDIEV